MKKCKNIFILFLACAMMTAISACGASNTSASSSPSPAASGSAASTSDPATANGTLVLATSADYPPYEFHKLSDGKDQVVGFDISLAQLIANKLGKKLEIRDVSFLLPRRVKYGQSGFGDCGHVSRPRP